MGLLPQRARGKLDAQPLRKRQGLVLDSLTAVYCYRVLVAFQKKGETESTLTGSLQVPSGQKNVKCRDCFFFTIFPSYFFITFPTYFFISFHSYILFHYFPFIFVSLLCLHNFVSLLSF